MRTNFTVSLAKIISEFSLETLNMPANPEKIQISTTEVNRPGLHMAGYFEFFDEKRIQIIGKSEESFLLRFTPEKAEKRLREFFSHKPVAVVICRNMQVDEVYAKTAAEYGVPLLRTAETTSDFTSALIAFLNLNLAPRVTRHGVLVSVYGMGVLITGDSGVGKSEAALELIRRGHQLVADDVVDICRVSDNRLTGECPEMVRHFMEIRGIGIIDIRAMYGIGAVAQSKSIDLVIHMEKWVEGKEYDRLGLNDEYITILGVKVPSQTMPVRPGRNLAIIIEVAARNLSMKKLGFSAARELDRRMNEMIMKRSNPDAQNQG